jgi:transcriptional regulator with XRE-family HTH domain
LNDPLEMFTDRIRKLREKSELGSIDAAAEKLGVSRGSLGGYERGKRLPDIDFLARFAQATGADLWELIRLRLDAAGFGDQAAMLQDTRGEYMLGGGGGQAVDSAAHARRALLSAKDLDPSWSLAIMEMATRGRITPEGVDQLIELLGEWSMDDERAWEWIEDHAEEVDRWAKEPDY